MMLSSPVAATVSLLFLFALLFALLFADADAELCYSCATANTADKWGPGSSWRNMYKEAPLSITDDCLHPGPSVRTFECPSSCFRVNFTETKLKDCSIIAKYTIRGCVDRMFEPHLSANARNRTGCQASTIKSKDNDIEKQSEVCYCKEDYCNSHATTGYNRKDANSNSSSVWIPIICLIAGLLVVAIIGYYLYQWKARLAIRTKKPFWVAGIFPAHAEHDTISLLRCQTENAKTERERTLV